MPKKSITVYLELSPNVEIKVSMQRREYNGIDSDPKVITGEPSAMEIFAAAKALRSTNLKFSLTPHLDFPES